MAATSESQPVTHVQNLDSSNYIIDPFSGKGDYTKGASYSIHTVNTNNTSDTLPLSALQNHAVLHSNNQSNDFEDVGMLSRADEASRKLQFSLDELIEQTSTSNTNAFGYKNTLHTRPLRRRRRDGVPQIKNNNGQTRNGENNALPLMRRPLYGHPYHTQTSMTTKNGINTLECDEEKYPLLNRSIIYDNTQPLPLANLNPMSAHPNFNIHPHILNNPGIAPKIFSRNNINNFNMIASNKNHNFNLPAPLELALANVDILYPPLISNINDLNLPKTPSSTDALIIKFKGTEVIKVGKIRGELILNSGGWKTASTRLIINSALKPLGLWIDSKPNEDSLTGEQNTLKRNDNVDHKILHSKLNEIWTVVDGTSFMAAFTDGMVIGQIGAQSRCRLLARASVIAQHLQQLKSNAVAQRSKIRNNVI